MVPILVTGAAVSAEGGLPLGVVVGASRGLGLALSESLLDAGYYVLAASRSKVESRAHLEWVAADMSLPGGPAAIIDAVDGRPVDCIVYNVGIWESAGIDEVSGPELESILRVNLTSAVQVLHGLRDGLRRAQGLVVLIGSTCGLPNEGASGLAYTASKWGLRGLASALRESLRADAVRVTCVSIGSTATELSEGAVDTVLSVHGGRRMPVDDVQAVLKCLLSLSPAATVKELWMPATMDSDA